ncbi:MAG TPA: deoxyribodipyrimidine photo-lyase [Chloroflexota bacterium]|nr:deoxyribodipyrimidine photo-lyase [Chloroflexota bacterium]
MTAAICWFRRDLRLKDNSAVAAAMRSADVVIPVLVLDQTQFSASLSGEKPLAFFLATMRSLDTELRRRDSYLIVRHGDPVRALGELARQTGARAIFAQEDVSPFGRQRDEKVAERLPLTLVHGISVHPSGAVVRSDGRPYTRYASFRTAWKKLPLPSATDLEHAPRFIPTPSGLSSESIPDRPALPAGVLFTPDEEEAQLRLHGFTEGEDAGITRYDAHRDRLDENGTSQLSPYLRFGMLSPRQAAAAAAAAIGAAKDDAAHSGAESWLDQLIWRDFFLSILYHFPEVLHEAFLPQMRGLPWETDERSLDAWKEGRTGYPIVDAAMRQLSQSGWIHNRARMIVASFLVKDLLIDWKRGERWFMQQLIDGEPALNNGNWQWVAGTGADSMPHFRVFNPILQSRKFDPRGWFIRRWLPEMDHVPEQFIHEPWTMDLHQQKAARCRIGIDYPAPIVDHGFARMRAIELYRSRAA